MTATVRRLAPTEVELHFEVSVAELDAARERVYRKLARRYRIPGFRPGHVPRRIFEQYVGADAIEHEAVDDVVPQAYSGALHELDLEPVDQPKLDIEPLEDSKPLRVKAIVAVRPTIRLSAYKDIRISEPPIAVTDAEIDHSLQALRRRVATLEPVIDRGLQMGDVVTLDYAGTIDGEPFEGGSAQNHTTEITANKFIPGFVDQLMGARPGEQRKLEVTFPTPYHSEQLAGKPAVFDVVVHEIKTPVLPELDDEFAKLVSDAQTVAELRADVQRRLELVARQRARDEMERELTQTLLAQHDFPLPDILVEREVERQLADIKESVAASGQTWEAYLQERTLDDMKIRAELTTHAQTRVKSALLIEEIAKTEGVDVTAAEVDRDVERMARATNQSRERVYSMLRESGGLGRLASAIRREKTVDALLKYATSPAPNETGAGQPPQVAK